MRKTYSFIFALVLMIALTIDAYAVADVTYALDDLGMSIDIPSEYIVFTRDISDSDPNLSAYGLGKEEMLDLMESRSIYLNAWDEDISFEIVITMIDSEAIDFNQMSNTMLDLVFSAAQDEYDKEGVTVEKHEIYQHDQTKFLKINFIRPSGTDTAYGLQYHTIYDSKAINITMQSYSGKIDSHKESIMEAIVETAHFDKEPQLSESLPDTDAFVYKDNETGVEFTVPKNWTEKPLSKERETLDAKFTSNKDPGRSILYGSTDIWAAMSPTEKEGLTRSDINQSYITADELAETFGISKNKISTVTLSEKEYYKYTGTSSTDLGGINLSTTITFLIRIENGYCYTFQFSGDRKNELYDDFKALVKSVKYPTIETPEPTVPPVADYGVISIIVSLLITVVVYAVPILIYRYGIVKHPLAKGRAKKITIVYGIIAFVVMSVLILLINGNGTAGISILLWSWVNYKVLTSGKEQPDETSATEMPQNSTLIADAQMTALSSDDDSCVPTVPTINQEQQDNLVDEDVVYCYKCGTKLSKSNQYCHKCGTKIIK